MKKRILILAVAAILGTTAKLAAKDVSLIEIKGVIGPSTASYISRAISIAEKRDDACLIIRLNTPGGLVSSTEDIVQDFYASKIPVVVYVSPSGSSATSAGTFITLAGDIAAMAPHTRIGAAHPVSMGFGGGGSESTNEIMSVKAENDLAKFVQTIAEKRGRNADWAQSAVRQSVSITSEEALDKNVIDLIANDIPDLLEQINGRTIGKNKLQTAGATVVEIPMAISEKFLNLLRPEVMFIFVLMAIYGIIAELNTPGAILPGVVGAIALVLVLYMSAVLPVNLAGLALIGLAVILFVIDVFAPTHGVLTFGGIVSFFLGALMLFNRADPLFRLSLPYIISGTLLTAAFFIVIVGAGLRAQRLPVRAGRETMLGKTVSALEKIDTTGGRVFIEGELWNAVSENPIEPGRPVEIVGVQGLTLKVKAKPA